MKRPRLYWGLSALLFALLLALPAFADDAVHACDDLGPVRKRHRPGIQLLQVAQAQVHRDASVLRVRRPAHGGGPR